MTTESRVIGLSCNLEPASRGPGPGTTESTICELSRKPKTFASRYGKIGKAADMPDIGGRPS
jgi:hypothetical protein